MLITPILRLLKRSRPSVYLVAVVDAIGYEVLLHHPLIDRLIVLDRRSNREANWIKRLRNEKNLLGTLRSERFDAAVDLFGGPRSALLAWLSGAPVRCGEAAPHRLRSRLYTHRVSVLREGEHLVRQKQKIVGPLLSTPAEDLPLELFLTEEETSKGRRSLGRAGIQEKETHIGFFPGAGWEHKRWPPEKFAELGDRLSKTHGTKPILIGGVRDRAACEDVASRMASPPVVLIQHSLRETMAVIGSLDLFVSNDTGPMHIAAAMGCPTVALFGPSNKIKYGPWGGITRMITEDLPCSPCPQQIDSCWKVGREAQECMKRIEVGRVYDAAVNLIKDRLFR